MKTIDLAIEILSNKKTKMIDTIFIEIILENGIKEIIKITKKELLEMKRSKRKDGGE